MANAFWPHDARIALTISLMFESGGEVRPDSVYFSPLADIPVEYPDLAGDTYFEYGYQEAIPRLLDLFDKHDIKVTVFAVGRAVERSPDLTREMARRGHEMSGHGWAWVPQYALNKEEEREFIAKTVEIVQRVTGQHPLGWNCWGLRGTPHTLELLQEQGFMYTLDDVSRDEPFIKEVNGQPFVIVPYTLHNNDLMCYEANGFSTSDYLQQLKDEFDWLYQEAATRRRHMAIPSHDRVIGRPNRVKVFDEFLAYAKSHDGVWFATRAEIARFMLDEADRG